MQYSDHDQILELLNRYSFTLDGGDLEGFAELFTDGEWGMEGSMHQGKEALLAGVLSTVLLQPDGTPKTRHISTNIQLEIDMEACIATCKRYGLVIQQTADLPLKPIFSADYFDTFSKVDDVWCFKKCELKRAFVGDLSHLFSQQLA
ncbi:SnoaL-like domain-containing protein [Pseudovibrio ascidiaceicola]|uniref:SnoaL-like domain-containing protein n=1 Tax=Pseudovibrio ascidiaceicola TaxID=285279 RepID=A0A1I3WKD7_9HYPH|nr:nuclear transport factor 2 family protein [Pseudovibrio ascidiaceicola]SFK07820.1 SnoaL-like domain-containing protein [Pseudovibrio ascidiaceicola]